MNIIKNTEDEVVLKVKTQTFYDEFGEQEDFENDQIVLNHKDFDTISIEEQEKIRKDYGTIWGEDFWEFVTDEVREFMEEKLGDEFFEEYYLGDIYEDRLEFFPC